MADREDDDQTDGAFYHDDDEEKEEEGEEEENDVLDLSNQYLTSLDATDEQSTSTLILDNNDLVKLDRIDKYVDVEQLSASNNRIVSMLGVSTLSNLSILCLSHNSIVTIEGIEDLSHLTWLDLSSNSIKVIEHLPKAGELYHIDLSDNDITIMADISRLKQLKTLLLHGNNISTLKQVPTHLPQILRILSLADNGIYDLNEICYLSSLPELEQLSLADNPCLMMTGDNPGFDHRPFVWNWCPSVAILDGFVVSEKERLLGEWLYSQGKGRHFHPGQHAQLVEYLASTCPLTATDQLRTEEDAHLSQVLNQQRRYRQQLQQPHGHQYQHHHHPHHHQQHPSGFAPTAKSDSLSSPRLGDSMKSSASEANTLENYPPNPTPHTHPHPSQGVNVNQVLYDQGTGDVPSHTRQYWAAPTDPNHRLQQGGGSDRLQANSTRDDGLALQEISQDDSKSNESLLDSESVYLPFDVPASPIIQRRPFTAPERSQAFPKFPVANASNASGKPPLATHHALVNTRPATATDARPNRYISSEHRPIKPLNQNLHAKASHRPNFEISPPVTSHLEPSVSQTSDTQMSTACSQDYDSSSEPVSESEPPVKPEPARGNRLLSNDNALSGSDVMNTSAVPPKDQLNLIKSVIGSKKSAHTASSSLTQKTKAATSVKSVAFSMKTSCSNNKSNTATTAPAMAAAALLRARVSKDNSQPLNDFDNNGNVNQDNSSITSGGGKNLSVDLRAHKKDLGESKQMKGRLNLEKMELRNENGLLGTVRDSGFLSRPSSDAVEDVQLHEPDHKAATVIQARWRGYWAREYNTKVVSVRKEIRARRAEDHIMLLRKDLERNQKLYEEEKRLRVLQMEAIRILYQEVQMLKSQTLNSTTDFNSTMGHTENNNSLTVTNLSTATSTTCSELNRTQELERTCVGLQRQVSQLQETLESVSSAVFRSNSLDGTSFDLTDNTQAVQVLPHVMNSPEHRARGGESSCWGSIPHSLSPYPSEEEEYYLQFPNYGAPTPPRRLQLHHYSRNSLVLTWQPSSSPVPSSEVEGNKHIIGYRVYVNDQLRAFICQRTSAMVNGLNPISTYKFYVKALSGFGESYESNIIMAKLAKGNERLKYSGSSATDSSGDSDKDIDSTENTERHRHRNRKHRKSPRSGEKKKSSRHALSRRVEFSEGLSELHEGNFSGINQNNSSLVCSPILTHPKLHTHRRTRSKDLQNSGDSLADISSKTTSSLGAGGGASGSGESLGASPIPQPQPPQHHKEGSRKLPESPLAGSGRERTPASDPKDKLVLKESSHESRSKSSSAVSDAPDGIHGRNSSVKKESPPVGSFKRQSPTHSGRKEVFTYGDASKTSSGGSANVSPACGSEGEHKVKISPKSAKEIIQSKHSPPSGSSGLEKASPLQTSGMSETFTIDKAHSFLEGVSAITENALAPRFVGSGAPHERSHRNPSSGLRGHRRNRSRDYQLHPEKSRSTPELTSMDGVRRQSGESDQDSLTVEEAQRLGIGRSPIMEKEDAKDGPSNEGEVSNSEAVSKARGHRRKRSKDLNHESSESRREENTDRGSDERREEVKSDHRRGGREAMPAKPEEISAASQGTKESSHSQSGRPVLDGRRRHSSGSGPSSPVIMAGERHATEDKTRMSVAEQMEQRYRSLKSSSLNSLSGRSEDGSRQDIDKRTPSSESLPATSYKGDTSKRTASNESLMSGSSSRGESSKRTQSSDSLMSIRTDTSKRSHSNESLPGSARTDPSRRSPSNESLPESIREENELELSEPYHPPQSCRRSQSMGSARDIAHSATSGKTSSSSAHRSGSSVMSKLLLKLESITRNNSSSVKETKKSLMKRSRNDESEASGSKPPLDDERKTGRRSRNLSESDAEGGTSDPGSQLPPRAPSESSSGSHSDDNRHSRRGHQRTPSDHRQPSSLPIESDPTRPMHSPIIMEGATVKKSGSNVRRNQSFHGLLPSKHQDTKTSPSSNEDISVKAEEQTAAPAQVQAETPARTRSHLRSRTPSPASARQPILSVAQLKRQSDSMTKTSPNDSSGGKPST